MTVYLAHFGLNQLPFGITPDTEFAFPSKSHREGINLLHFALASGEGIIKVVGEIGTGKTLLCRSFLRELDGDWQAAYIPNPQMGPRELLLEIADELGASEGEMNIPRLVKRINQRLIEIASAGRKVVLCIDEAQTMPRLTLESLRLLSNLETEKRKLLHIVLFGQTELDETLAIHTLRQLRQRIAFAHRLQRLDANEVSSYVAQRLDKAGHIGEPIFSPAALKALYHSSAGAPRVVNILANKALLAAYGEGQTRIEPRHVRAAARDTEGAVNHFWWPW